jgi:hypothetical protein
MAQKVARTDINRQAGYLYFVDEQGDVSRATMARGGRGSKREGGRRKKVAKVGIRKEKGFLYFIDKDGDVARARMVRNGGGSSARSHARRRSRSRR